MLAKLVFVSVVALAGCYGTVEYTHPDLAYVSPGVHVIADYDEPIFYANGYYWYNSFGAWYRSRYYTGGWAYAPAPPRAIASIHYPYAYRYYRPYGYTPHHRPVSAHNIQRPVYHGYPAPVRRDGYRY